MQRRRHLFLAALVIASAARLAAQPFDPRLLSDVHWRLVGPVPRRPRARGGGRAGAAGAFLLRRGRRRRVGERERRAHVGADLRRAADRLDRRDRRRALRPARALRRLGRGRHALGHLARQRHVPLRRRRQDLGARRPRGHPADRRASSWIRATPNVVFVAALGHAYGPEPRARRLPLEGRREELDARPLQGREHRRDRPRASIRANPKTILAALWQTRRPPWNIYPPSNGPGSGLYRSDDGGDTWKAVAGGLPSEKLGRIGIAFAPSEPRRVYALVDAKEGGLYASGDGGATLVAGERGHEDLGARLVLRRRRRSIRRMPNTVYACDVTRVPVDRRRQEVPADQGCAGRRRLPPALDRSVLAAPHDPRHRPGRGRQRGRRRRRGAPGTTSRPPSSTTWPPTTGFRTGSTARSRTAAPRRRRRARTTPPSRCATGAPWPWAARTATSPPTPRIRTSSMAAA